MNKQKSRVKTQTLADDTFKLPKKISPFVPGMLPEAVRGINVLLNAHEFGRDLFETDAPHYEDWVMLFILITNESQGRSTVTKNFVEVTGRAYGTVRASLKRFEALGYIRPLQRIGRSELYVPTEKLKKAVNQWGRKLWPCIEAMNKENKSTAGTSRVN